jgi:predicted RNA-binding Zn ribbon-like protein
MADKKKDAGSLKLLGGHLSLDFVNTLDWRGTDKPVEFLNTFHDIVLWSRHVGLCTHRDFQELSRQADRSEKEAKRIWRQAIELREILFRIFSTVINKKNPSPKDMADFNLMLSGSIKNWQILKTKKGYAWDTSGGRSKLDWILNPILHSATDLLLSNDLKNIKTCADPACGWLFLDVSRNKSRRWCDMNDCGNRAKASRFYKKSKQ